MMQGTPGKGFPEEVVRGSLEVGYTGIDSAFGDSSYQTDALREVLKTVDRSALFITSKIPGPSFVDPEQTEATLDAALEDLGLDYVDLMLSHGPGRWQNWTVESSLQRHWQGFETFYKAGKARAIGVSNWCPRAILSVLKTATVVPHVNQVIYHAGMGEDPDTLMSFARYRGIVIQSESATDWSNPHILGEDPYKSIGAKYNKSGIQVALRWLTQRGYPAIQGSSNPKHQAEDLDIFDFELSAEDLAAISAERHCIAGYQLPPHCHVPYFRSGEQRICNVDGKGGFADNWECDDDFALMNEAYDLQGGSPRLATCSMLTDLCFDVASGATVRKHCKKTCQQPCQVGSGANLVL